MPTLMQVHEFANGAPALRQRFSGARLVAAWNVLNEDPGTANHAARLTWAEKILADYDADLSPEFLRFLSNATIQAQGGTATDGQIMTAVTGLVNAFATA